MARVTAIGVVVGCLEIAEHGVDDGSETRCDRLAGEAAEPSGGPMASLIMCRVWLRSPAQM